MNKCDNGAPGSLVDRVVLRLDVLLRDEDQAHLFAVHSASFFQISLDLARQLFQFLGGLRQHLGKGLRDLRIENLQIFGQRRDVPNPTAAKAATPNMSFLIEPLPVK